jgi:hypothetical protein
MIRDDFLSLLPLVSVLNSEIAIVAGYFDIISKVWKGIILGYFQVKMHLAQN